MIHVGVYYDFNFLNSAWDAAAVMHVGVCVAAVLDCDFIF
jgi:hypothetical protein